MIDLPASVTDACAIYGPAVGVGVALLKRLGVVGRIIARNPKIVAAVLSAASVAFTTGLASLASASLSGLAVCVGLTFAGAVATHEVALDPLAKSLGLPDPKKAPG